MGLSVTQYHTRPIAKTNYQVFVERDGSFGVVLSQMGAMVRTARGFASKDSAQDWIARDTQSENADNPFREGHPGNPPAH
jgi:hypothetical protein